LSIEGNDIMTISALTSSGYASLLASPAANTASGTGSASLGDQLLAALGQSSAASGTPANALLQELVSLSPAATTGQASATPQTYNAQGLLQQVQSNMMLNDPLLQPDTTGTSSGDSFLQSLLTLPQSTAGNSANPAAAQALGAATGTTNLNADWSQLLKQNPALASTLVQSEMAQNVISMLGS
jgi:hypothetical protein